MFASALLLSLAVQETVVVAKPEAKPERKICKSVGTGTGSRMGGTRVCRTATEWKGEQTGGADQRYVNDSLDTGGFGSGSMTPTEPTRAIGR